MYFRFDNKYFEYSSLNHGPMAKFIMYEADNVIKIFPKTNFCEYSGLKKRTWRVFTLYQSKKSNNYFLVCEDVELKYKKGLFQSEKVISLSRNPWSIVTNKLVIMDILLREYKDTVNLFELQKLFKIPIEKY